MKEKVGSYIIDSGGKRLRPLVSLLSAKACDYHGKSHTTVAAAILNGAHIVRVHDVANTMTTVKIMDALMNVSEEE